MLNSRNFKILAIAMLSVNIATSVSLASGTHTGGHKKNARASDMKDMKMEKAGDDDVTTPGHKLQARSSTKLAGRLVLPKMDPVRGKKLFVSKGCVTCHSINGIGGHDAPKLDAHTMDKAMNPFDFAAKMWRAAPAMIAVQEEAFGEQIYFTGDELADIAAFVHNDKAQHDFSEDDITPQIRKIMNHEHGGKKSGDGHDSN